MIYRQPISFCSIFTFFLFITLFFKYLNPKGWLANSTKFSSDCSLCALAFLNFFFLYSTKNQVLQKILETGRLKVVFFGANLGIKYLKMKNLIENFFETFLNFLTIFSLFFQPFFYCALIGLLYYDFQTILTVRSFIKPRRKKTAPI